MQLPLKSPVSLCPLGANGNLSYVNSVANDLLVSVFAFYISFLLSPPRHHGLFELQSTTVNSFINQASVHGVNY